MFLSLIVHNLEVEEPGDMYNHHFESLKDIHVNINKERGGGRDLVSFNITGSSCICLETSSKIDYHFTKN